jgi:hypothetical protein
MDYNSITTSDVEWRAAVCLCGMSSCRGSFLSFSTQDDLQQVCFKVFQSSRHCAMIIIVTFFYYYLGIKSKLRSSLEICISIEIVLS